MSAADRLLGSNSIAYSIIFCNLLVEDDSTFGNPWQCIVALLQ